MKINLRNNYSRDFFKKLNFQFNSGYKILDLGCGNGADSYYFIKDYKLHTFAIDIYEHGNIKKINGLTFKIGSIYDTPYPINSFDYVFLHDVLHHIDEPKQRRSMCLKGLRNIKRVTKKGGYIIIAEGNRYNPLFYPHMVKLHKHEHFTQDYFKGIINQVFSQVEYKYFEAHSYPRFTYTLKKVYEFIMEHLIPKQFLAYNIAIIRV